MASILKAENISMDYADTTVFNGINFSASGGEIHALLGRNASGKTTLGLILAGLLVPGSGTVSFNDGVYTGSRDKAKKLGVFMVEQNPVLFSNLEIYANIIYGHEKFLFGSDVFMPSRSKMLGISKDIMRRVGLNIDPEEKTARLSEGESQLVSIAHALICNPLVLILDEFSASLTGHEIKRIHSILKQMRGEGRCVILISNNLNEQPNNCDSVSVIHRNGRLNRYTIEEAHK